MYVVLTIKFGIARSISIYSKANSPYTKQILKFIYIFIYFAVPNYMYLISKHRNIVLKDKHLFAKDVSSREKKSMYML